MYYSCESTITHKHSTDMFTKRLYAVKHIERQPDFTLVILHIFNGKAKRSLTLSLNTGYWLTTTSVSQVRIENVAKKNALYPIFSYFFLHFHLLAFPFRSLRYFSCHDWDSLLHRRFLRFD